MSLPLRLIAPALVLTLLSACAHQQARDQPCPTGGVLKDAETFTVYDGRGKEPANVVQRVTISNVSLKCSYRERKHVDSTLAFDITAERGPAGRAAMVSVPYFVAVSRGGKAILARESYVHSFDLQKASRASAREEIDRVRIPLAPRATGASYEVIVGLEVTQEQLAENRARHPHD